MLGAASVGGLSGEAVGRRFQVSQHSGRCWTGAGAGGEYAWAAIGGGADSRRQEAIRGRTVGGAYHFALAGGTAAPGGGARAAGHSGREEQWYTGTVCVAGAAWLVLEGGLSCLRGKLKMPSDLLQAVRARCAEHVLRVKPPKEPG